MDLKEIVDTLKNVHVKLNELQTVGVQSASLLVAIADAIATVHNALAPQSSEEVIVEPEVVPVEGE